MHAIQDFYSHTDWIEGDNMAKGNPSVYAANGFGSWNTPTPHPPYYLSIFSLDKIAAGDGAELSGVLVYSGGAIPWWGLTSAHNRFASDENSNTKFRTRNPPFGLGPTAMARSQHVAQLVTRALIYWVCEKLNLYLTPVHKYGIC